jgi:hypothetical protein
MGFSTSFLAVSKILYSFSSSTPCSLVEIYRCICKKLLLLQLRFSTSAMKMERVFSSETSNKSQQATFSSERTPLQNGIVEIPL